jgi:hypothetical protein
VDGPRGDDQRGRGKLTGVRGQTVYNWLQRYLACHQVAALVDVLGVAVL